MFSKILVESAVIAHPQTIRMLEKFNHLSITEISKIEDYFGRYKKPYLHKRDSLQLWIGRKEGELIKAAPPAYGKADVPHYYFVHAYNCIYECEYCYLQGYFKSPDIVLYVNHDEICDSIVKTCVNEHKNDKEVWFHAGEFSDSLALSGLTDEWAIYWETFKNLKNGYLELRTKSSNIRPLLKLTPHRNIVISFSLSPADACLKFDHKAPPLAARLKALAKLSEYGYQIGIHLDPIIYTSHTILEYKELLQALADSLKIDKFAYMSLGVVRFSKESYYHVKQNYPQSKIFDSEMIKSSDGKIRYPKPLRMAVLNKIKETAIHQGFDESKIYLCME